MTESQKTEGTEGTPDAKPEAEKVEQSAERKVPESALSKQAADFNAQIARLTKQVNSNDADKLKAKEDKLKADGELQKLIDVRDEKIAEMESNAGKAARSLLESSAREQLRNLGMNDALYLQGALAGLPTDATAESVETWAKTMKVDNEAAFTAPATPVKIPGTPDPAVNGGSADWKQVEALTKSDDPEVSKKARDQLTAYYQEHGKFPD